MSDQTVKKQIIRSIEQLQLAEHLIFALDDAQQAQDIVLALHSLQKLSEQWN